jgi:uroporphyrinogen-III synthase
LTVLLTRARAQAEATAARLQERGIDTLIAPLVRIEAMAKGDDALAGFVQAVLVTSHNGAQALAGRSIDRAVPVLAVGNRTASTLRDAGFTNVRSADGDAEALAALALATLDRSGGAIVHVRGETMNRSPLAPLRDAGYMTAETILYRSVTIPRFAPEIIPRLDTVDTALVYSPGSAFRLSNALAALPPGRVRPLQIVAISTAALAPLQDHPDVASLRAADHPSEDALLSLLDEIAKNPVAPPEIRR